MLHDIYNYSQLRRRTGEAPRATLDSRQARLNPWLLWRPDAPQRPEVLTVAELAECVCPDLCNRDHANE